MPTVSFYTLGCKLNFVETSSIGRQFIDRGFRVVGSDEPADVCVINTCSVTARADRECRQVIRRAVKTSKNPFVIVTGCYAQLEPEEVASIDGVDVVLGANEKFSLFNYVGDLEKQLYPHVFVSEVGRADNFGPAYSSEVGNRTRAFLKIQDGCDYNCAFCTIPLARGVSRSLPVDVCVAQSRELVSQGYREIVLTGVNVGDYGTKASVDLLALLQRLVTVDGLDRIRISSIEPNLLTDEIIAFVASEQKMCKHFHIPLQSGTDEILRKMRRRYTTNDYVDRVHRIREFIPHCGIGADVIVGFPGETDLLFEKTSSFLKELPVSYLHVFTYSERPNTPAVVFENPVEPKVRFKRNEILRALGLKKRRVFHESMVGTIGTVLFEGDVEDSTRFGFTSNYVRVGVPAESAVENDLVKAEIIGVEDGRCVGRVVHEQVAA